nr:MAG TPA: hypothetical protein [Caudoviricetes sp.]
MVIKEKSGFLRFEILKPQESAFLCFYIKINISQFKMKVLSV